jgi:hypothetical protein
MCLSIDIMDYRCFWLDNDAIFGLAIELKLISFLDGVKMCEFSIL